MNDCIIILIILIIFILRQKKEYYNNSNDNSNNISNGNSNDNSRGGLIKLENKLKKNNEYCIFRGDYYRRCPKTYDYYINHINNL